MQPNELKSDLFGLSSSSNVVASATASSFLPPPTLIPSSDIDNTSLLTYGHMKKVNDCFLFFELIFILYF